MDGTVLLERDHLLDEFDRRLRAAGEGDGSLVFLAGEAGAGKTSVVEAWTGGLGNGTVVLRGACDPLTTPRPLSPLLDIAAQPESGLGGLTSEGVEHFAAFDAFLAGLRHTIRPIVLVLEDVHWADDATFDFLRLLGRKVGDTKSVAVCTFRHDEVGSRHPLRILLGDLATSDHTSHYTVDLLSPEAVRALSAGRWADTDRLYRLTDGNPFYVTEMLAVGEELPLSVQNAVLARVRRLGDGAQRVAEAVSIAPRHLALRHAVNLAESDIADVDEALAAGVLLGSGGLLRFRHELARVATEDAIPIGRRTQLHRRMLDLLLEEGSSDLARIAHHAACAEAGHLVAKYAPQAARQAARRGAHREAAGFFQMALDRTQHLDSDTVAALRASLAEELYIVDDQHAALRQREMVVDHYRQSGDDMALARALLSVSGSYWLVNRLEDNQAAVDEALELLRQRGPSPELGSALFVAAWWWMLHRRRQAALGYAQEAQVLAEVLDDEFLAARALYVIGSVELTTGDASRGLRLTEEAIARYQEGGKLVAYYRGQAHLGWAAVEARRYGEGLKALRVLMEMGRRTEFDYNVDLAQGCMARCLFEQGRWDEAADAASPVVQGPPGRSPLPSVSAHAVLGRVRARRGDPGAEEALKTAVALARGAAISNTWFALSGLAEFAWLTGRNDEIASIVEDAYRVSLEADSPWARGELGFWMWRAGVVDEPPPEAAHPYALHIAGRWQEAAEAWRELGCPYEEADALADSDEDERLIQAVGIFQRLGARPAAARVAERLRGRGVTTVPRGPRPFTRDHPAGLTTRQVEVLELMAEGLSNPEIASRLFVSRKTVEHHVSAILGKLGVAKREEAVTAASRFPNPE